MIRNFGNTIIALGTALAFEYWYPELTVFQLVVIYGVFLTGLMLWDINKKLHEE